ncbi:hypothetical protein [Desulfonatronovibrio hydrogenovorans]|uniref:hypothetical protein n=1 Tax=Desulfonatronovibrio hydrogenovorans TaxID=53245 RepID=UPI00048E04C2|nr:hypothetical protein [Desulfonatronovibrio hydrogenovorans]
MFTKKELLWYKDLVYSKKIVIIFMMEVHDSFDNISKTDDYYIRKADYSSIDDLLLFHDLYCMKWNYLFNKEEVLKRFDEGHMCFAAFSKDKHEIVGFSWYAINSVYSRDLKCWFDINNISTISYNTFVREDFRGMSVQPSIRKQAFIDLKKSGVKDCFSYVSDKNQKMIRSIHKNNARVVGTVEYGYMLSKYYVNPKIPADLGIRARLGSTDHFLVCFSN